METNTSGDRVRENTAPEILARIDRSLEEKVLFYSSQPREVLSRRIAELDREWDVERILEANASSLALTGLFLGVARGRKYLLLTAGVLGFLLTHAIQGWCPPLPILRRMGVRTRAEIDQEKYALKALRGDFQNIAPSTPEMRTNEVQGVISAVSQ